jgi:hypothetical protein
MLSYVTTRKDLVRQSGNSGSITVILPNTLDMEGKTVYFQISTAGDSVVFGKNSDGNGITLDGLIAVVSLTRSDTSGLSGDYLWAMKVEGGDEYIDLAYGTITFTNNFLTCD